MSDWQIHPRNVDLSRSFDPLSGWRSLTLVELLNRPDSWTVTGPASALAVFEPGMGCILDRDGEQVTSGQVAGVRRGSVGGTESMTVAFAADLAALGGRVVRPTPTSALVPGTIGTFPDEYDLRSGTIEDLCSGYTRSHIGDLALVDRQLLRLRLPVSLARGGTTQVSARLDTLGVLVGSLTEAGNLRVTIDHVEDGSGGWLDLSIQAAADLSADIRFGPAGSTATGLITEWDYELAAPTTTRALVALGGDGPQREFLEVRDTAAETLWGRSWETLIDQRSIAPDSTDKLAEATRAGLEALESGKGTVKVAFTPQLGPDLEFRRDVNVGSIVGVDLPNLDPITDKIREAVTNVSVESGQATERVSVVVGTPDAPSTRSQQQTAKALRAINVIQRSK